MSCDPRKDMTDEEMAQASRDVAAMERRMMERVMERASSTPPHDAEQLGFDAVPARYGGEGEREVIDRVRDEWPRRSRTTPDDAFYAYCRMTAQVYRMRAGRKGPAEVDLKKASWFEAMARHVRFPTWFPDPREARATFEAEYEPVHVRTIPDVRHSDDPDGDRYTVTFSTVPHITESELVLHYKGGVYERVAVVPDPRTYEVTVDPDEPRRRAVLYCTVPKGTEPVEWWLRPYEQWSTPMQSPFGPVTVPRFAALSYFDIEMLPLFGEIMRRTRESYKPQP